LLAILVIVVPREKTRVRHGKRIDLDLDGIGAMPGSAFELQNNQRVQVCLTLHALRYNVMLVWFSDMHVGHTVEDMHCRADDPVWP
jgi:hypothetical protein